MLKKIIFIFIYVVFANTMFADTLKFVQISDVHTSEKGIKYNGRNLDNSQTNLRNAVKNINNDKSIQYVFFTGDSVDKSTANLYKIFFDIVNDLNKPYYMAPGNHDVIYGGEMDKAHSINIIKEYSYAHQNSGNFAVNLNEYFTAVMLDGTYDDRVSSQGYISDNTLNWLDNVLEENRNKNVLIFQHFPVVEPAKETNYSHPHNIVNKKKLIKVLKKHGNVVLISSGHYHVKGEFKKYGVKHYSTPALFLTPSYYREVIIDYDGKKVKNINSVLKLN